MRLFGLILLISLMPHQIEECPDGLIHIYDQIDSSIKVFSPEGTYLRKLGRAGQGPGEIQRADGVCFGFNTEGHLFFTEFFTGESLAVINSRAAGIQISRRAQTQPNPRIGFVATDSQYRYGKKIFEKKMPVPNYLTWL